MKSIADIISNTNRIVDASAWVRCLTTKTGDAVMRPVHPGIVAAARRLGVSRQHLHAVLTGRRHSPRLVVRYRTLRGA